MITPAQCRAARAWLNLTQAELGMMIGRGDSAVARFENGGTLDQALALALQHVLEERGIIFTQSADMVHAPRSGIEGPE
jgi:transcriptional regulator with XRE-family HTH domain